MKKFILSILVIFIFSVIYMLPVFSEPEVNLYNVPGEYKAPTSGKENVLIILDCSYSMDDEIDGRRKIDIARDVINSVLRQIPENINIGLRVYGHTSGFLGFDGCKATELKVPIGQNTQNSISAEMKKLNAVGWTPICYSLQQSIDNDFLGVSGRKRIILVSDGMETCGGSPCQFAVDLMKKRTDVTIDVIGFNILSEPAAISQLKCVALATHGKFYTPNSADEFAKSFRNTLNVQTEVRGRIYSK